MCPCVRVGDAGVVQLQHLLFQPVTPLPLLMSTFSLLGSFTGVCHKTHNNNIEILFLLMLGRGHCYLELKQLIFFLVLEVAFIFHPQGFVYSD